MKIDEWDPALSKIAITRCGSSKDAKNMFKVNNRNTAIRYEICSKLTLKTPERCQWRRFGVFNVVFEHISHLVLVFTLITLSRYFRYY